MWYVLHTAPHREAQLSRLLAAQGVQTYVPQFPRRPATRPGSVRDRQPRWLFPRYIFLSPPPGFDAWDRIRWAPGVTRLLSEDGRPAAVPDDVIEHLRRRLAQGELAPRRRFQRGQRLSILSGPLRMVDAIFERDLDAASRVRILITLLGRPLLVDVDPAIVSAAV